MSIFKDITQALNKIENITESNLADIDDTLATISEMEGPGVRLGLGPQRNVNKQPASKGDIILRVEVDGSLVPFVVSNENGGEEPTAKNTKRGEEISIVPELLVIGDMTNNPQLKAASQRMALKYPDRKIFLYGDTKQKKEGASAGGDSVRAAPGNGNANPRMR